MKKLLLPLVFVLFLAVCIQVCYAEEEEHSPWVYPSGVNPSTVTGPWSVPIHAGTNIYELIVWNHHNVYPLTSVRFVIAVPSGVSHIVLPVIIKNVSNSFVWTINSWLSGFSPGYDPGIPGGVGPDAVFPCPYNEITVTPRLTSWQSPDGWQGASDKSGLQLNVSITVNSPNVLIYFCAWGLDKKSGEGVVAAPWTETTYTRVPEFTLSVPIITTIGTCAYMLVRRKNAKKKEH